MSMPKSYLGDGVYAEFDGYQIELYLHNGREKLDSIILEPEVWSKLLKFVDMAYKNANRPDGL